ncbi:polysaccharide deacetylase family protein [Pedobacter sp.]|nr:polysaccharide deacetylase family protein [Candidatus Saccharibacteria bacterium]
MSAVVLYLHVHQPFRVTPYSVFDTGVRHDYFESDDYESQENNARILRKVAEKSYIPTNIMLKELLEAHDDFRLSLSITGTFIEQCEKWAPDVLRSFQELVATGRVDIVAETYYHSLAFFYSRFEFEKQVMMHREKIQSLFGVTPTVFRNTELAYNNELAMWAESAGYKGILAEGWDPILGYRSSNYVYQPPNTDSIKLLLKNYRLSDDVAFRFSNQDWNQWPLDAKTYLNWLPHDNGEQVINLFMDYETFGEHQWASTGIFNFMRHLVADISQSPDLTFMTVSQAAALESRDVVDMPWTVTWADTERDLTAWLGNRMQQEAMRHLYDLEESVLRTGDWSLIDDWRKLQTSDHVYYMCTKWFQDGDVHAYFSPYDSPYDAFLYFMNALRDIRWRVLEHSKGEI